jgi:hypothetical protein
MSVKKGPAMTEQYKRAEPEGLNNAQMVVKVEGQLALI